MNLRYGVYYILRFFSRLIFGRNFLIRNKNVAKIYIFASKIAHYFSYFHWKQKFWERKNPEAPWLVQDAIRFIEEWLNDDTEDLSKTMSKLDNVLTYSEKMLNKINSLLAV